MWPRSKPYFLVLPAVGVIAVLFFLGLIQGLIQSMGYFPAADQFKFTLLAYQKLFRSDEFYNSLLLTLRISIISTATAGLLGAFVSVSLFMLGKSSISSWLSLLRRLFLLPLFVPHLVGAYLIVLLCMQSGWLSRIAYQLGWVEEMNDFPILTNDLFGWGIILTYTWKEAPFIVLMIYPVLLRVHDSWLETARVFGASSWGFVREIAIPLLLPVWFTSVFIVFAFTFSAFEVPFLLGVTYPKMLPVFSYELYYGGELTDRPAALAVNVVLALITAGLGLLAFQMNRRWINGTGRGWQ